MLAENDRQPKRQRLTLVRIYQELRNRGYDGSYDAVRRVGRRRPGKLPPLPMCR